MNLCELKGFLLTIAAPSRKLFLMLALLAYDTTRCLLVEVAKYSWCDSFYYTKMRRSGQQSTRRAAILDFQLA